MSSNIKQKNNSFGLTIKAILGFGVISIMSGCTTLEDFQKMSPETRATKTCSSDVTVSHYRYKANSARNQIDNIDGLLRRGYKTKESCTTITYNSDSRDKSSKNKGEIRRSSKVICREVIIPISDYVYELEKNRRNELMNTLEDANQLRRVKFDSCYKKVINMSAENAFNRYDN